MGDSECCKHIPDHRGHGIERRAFDAMGGKLPFAMALTNDRYGNVGSRCAVGIGGLRRTMPTGKLGDSLLYPITPELQRYGPVKADWAKKFSMLHNQFCDCIPDFLTDGGGFDYLFLMPGNIQLLGGKWINERTRKWQAHALRTARQQPEINLVLAGETTRLRGNKQPVASRAQYPQRLLQKARSR